MIDKLITFKLTTALLLTSNTITHAVSTVSTFSITCVTPM